MGFVDNNYVHVGYGEGSLSDQVSTTTLIKESEIKEEYVVLKGAEVNKADPLLDNDLHAIIYFYESGCSEWREEDYAIAYHYRDVYGLRQFSYRVREQLNYYPGMHQTETPPGEDPAKIVAEKMAENRLQYWNQAMSDPDSFMSGLKSRQKDFDYVDIFASDTGGEDRAKQLGKVLTECIPCFDRLLDGADLLPDADLLELHLLNIKIRTDLLDKLMSLLADPGYYLDICELLNLLTKMCPQDLLAMLILLSQYLAKLNLNIKFNLDLIISLVGPILSPFLDALSAWLDKWIQLILEPIICVVDHVNEVIMLAQQAKIPFSETDLSVEGDVGAALPFHANLNELGGTGVKSSLKGEGGAWAENEGWAFRTPDKEKYNPTVPEYPHEESIMALEEVGETAKPSFTPAERADRNKQWAEMRKKEREKREYIPPPLRRPNPDGRRWFKEEAEDVSSYKFQKGMRPPEEQTMPKDIDEYYLDPSMIVNSILQLRNILQGAIAYVQDWFEYITQMIYDLIGTDIGWMSKKTDTTLLKSRIIQLIYLIQAIIRAISKNGLKCGADSNFDQRQLKFILEEVMNKWSPSYNFAVNPDGSVEVLPLQGSFGAETIDRAQGAITSKDFKERPDTAAPMTEISMVKDEPKQKTVKSGIIIKDCLKSVAAADVEKVRQWIADFERSS